MAKRLLKYTKGSKILLIISFISTIINVATILSISILVGYMIDNIIDKNNVNFNNIIYYIKLGLIATITYFVFKFIQDYLLNRVTNNIIKNLREEAFNKLLNVRLKSLDLYTDGNVLNTLINDIENVKDGLIQGLNQLITGIFTIIGTFGFMLYINKWLTLLVVCLTPLSMIFSYVISKKSYKSFKETAEAKANFTSYVEEMINNQKLIKSMNYEEGSFNNFFLKNNLYKEKGYKSLLLASLVNPTTRVINNLIYILSGLLGSILILKGYDLEIGLLTSFLSYCSQFTKPFNEISVVIANIQQSFASLNRVFNFLDIKTNPNGTVVKDIKGNIEIKDLNFSYDGKRNVIENFNIKIKEGQKIAIVGRTGSGKTTLINLLMRFYLHEDGSILIDNTEINNLEKTNLRKHIGMVLQDTWLFKGSVKDNVSYSKENASLDEIKSACKKVYADGFIKRLKDGYDTVISEEDNISLGERQLLSIARVMLLNPPVLILDEATSNIDALTEIKIQKAFDELMKNKTSIVIAHRLTTIKEADMIIVMDYGKIIEVGNHQELLEKKGYYYNLYHSQFNE